MVNKADWVSALRGKSFCSEREDKLNKHTSWKKCVEGKPDF